MFSCSRRTHIALFNKKKCLLVQQDNMCSCSTGLHVFLFNKKTATKTHVFLFSKKTCILVQQENMSPCSTRKHFFLFNKKTCLLVEQDISSCSTRRRLSNHRRCNRTGGGDPPPPLLLWLGGVYPPCRQRRCSWIRGGYTSPAVTGGHISNLPNSCHPSVNRPAVAD